MFSKSKSNKYPNTNYPIINYYTTKGHKSQGTIKNILTILIIQSLKKICRQVIPTPTPSTLDSNSTNLGKMDVKQLRNKMLNELSNTAINGNLPYTISMHT